MNLEYITNYIDSKRELDDNLIKITYYELKIKENLSEEDIQNFLVLSKQRLENLGYKIFKQGEFYNIDGKRQFIDNNIFYVAIKN